MLLSPLLIATVFAVGVLVGGVGIGGVLLLPALSALGGIPLHTAIPACMAAFIATGAVGALIYARHRTVDWRRAAGLCIGGVPGAYLGAFLLPHVSALALELGIAALLLASGWYALSRPRPGTPESGAPPPLRRTSLSVIGFVTGVGSALTGTGGPLLLIPILVWRQLPMRTAVGLAQVIQIPVAVTATLGNTAHGQVDWRLSMWLALALTGGAALGAKLAHVVPAAALHKLVAALLVAAGLFMLTELSSGG
ncbi:MAG: sulfite exporter TauE/SafE family protein [Gammaproteobacteria bacterium]|nr:sulfite exporter TauE/SafE family protein [Gammaproteobacteria bacterium]